MTNVEFVLKLLSLVAHALTKQPNILMIVADDMGYQEVGFRRSDIKTPNIDILAKQGFILQNHYVLEVCTISSLPHDWTVSYKNTVLEGKPVT